MLCPSGLGLGSGRPWYRAVACLAMDLCGGALAPAMVLTAIDTWYYRRQLHQEAGMVGAYMVMELGLEVVLMRHL